MNDVAKCFAEHLKARRKAMGMTQKELAEKLGYSEKAVSKWENGTGMPPAVMFPMLSAVLETTMEELLIHERDIRYYLGIDGGGTKTEFLLADRDGKELKRVLLGTCNPNDIGMEATLAVLNQGIMEICGSLLKSQISVFAGIAGSTTGDHKQRILAFLEKHRFGRIAADSDAKNAVAAALCGDDGIAVILGTGSIAFVQVNGESRRIGGFGYLLGDGGSGFSIGRDAIAAALTDEDGCSEPTILRRLVHEKCGGETIWDQVSQFYKGGKRLIAGYAPLVFEAYRLGDWAAKEILRKNMKAVARLIEGAASRLPQLSNIPVVLCGGLTRDSDILIPILKEELIPAKVTYSIDLCQRSMAHGALILAGIYENKGENEDVKN